MAKRILLADDDTALSTLISEYLEAKEYAVTHAANAIDALRIFADGDFDLCILDVRMPMRSGFELAEDIRKVDKDVPIIFLTGESQTEQRIKGLTLGADDYLTKPFSFKELHLRIEAIFRRMGTAPDSASKMFRIGAFTLDPSLRTMTIGASVYKLSEIETRLLEAFCKAANGSVTREHLLTTIWQDEAQLKGRSLNVYISKLRKRLSADPQIEILNVHGTGYRLVVRS